MSINTSVLTRPTRGQIYLLGWLEIRADNDEDDSRDHDEFGWWMAGTRLLELL